MNEEKDRSFGEESDLLASVARSAQSAEKTEEEAKDRSDAPKDAENAGIGGDGEDENIDTTVRKKSAAGRFWEKYFDWKVKDIVFLAVISAAMLLTSAVMVFVSQLPVFGIAQVVTALQFSVFPAIGLMKVRKTGSLFLMSIFTGVFLLFMAQEMFITNLISGIIVEVLIFAIFSGYGKDLACYLGAALFIPVSIPVYLGHIMIFGSESVYRLAAIEHPWVAVGVSLAAVAIAFIGALIGLKIARELKKSGVLKK